MTNPRSNVWIHFKKCSDVKFAQCHICSAKLQCKGGSTSGLAKNLQRRHKINANKRPAPTVLNVFFNVNDGLSVKKKQNQQSSIIDFGTQKVSLKEIVARLATVDNMTINSIITATSSFVRDAIH